MNSKFTPFDSFQIGGFIVSAAVSIILILDGQGEIISVTLGFIIAALVQLFDLQLRLSKLEKKLLEAHSLSQSLYNDEWLFRHIQRIVKDYQLVDDGWFEIFKDRARDIIIECHEELHSLSEGSMSFKARSPYSFGARGIKYATKSLKAVSTSGKEYWLGAGEKGITTVNRGVTNTTFQ